MDFSLLVEISNLVKKKKLNLTIFLIDCNNRYYLFFKRVYNFIVKRITRSTNSFVKKWGLEYYFDYICILTFKAYFQNDENKFTNLRPNRSFPKLILSQTLLISVHLEQFVSNLVTYPWKRKLTNFKVVLST